MQKRFSSLTGIDVEIIENPNKERKFHPETEIIYVIEGKVKLTVRDRLYELEKGGILFVNSMVPYKVNGSGAFICEFHISCHVLAHIVKDSSERLQMMIHYVNRNYQSPISLKDLSEEIFLSVQMIWISRPAQDAFPV